MSLLRFPSEFVWGVATSAYQIEGSIHADGRGESIWDRYTATSGMIGDGSDGSTACDHFVRWPEDVALMKAMGLQAYRFSIAWPRIFPTGTGASNTAGLDFYERLVDGLLAAGLRPFVTLYHWDLPQALEDRGGWPARDTGRAFAEYADAVSRRLGDRVKDWITHNEPWCISTLGYQFGVQAPGKQSPAAALATSHHLLWSHGLAVPIIRGNSPGARVGITLNLVPAVPASGSAADRDACRAFDGTFNRWYLDPLYGRGYPTDVIADHVAHGNLTTAELPFVEPGDLDTIAVPTDFLGVNYYSRGIMRSGSIPEEENEPRVIAEPEPTLLTDMGWEVHGPGLTLLTRRLVQDYAPPSILITENGAAYAVGPAEDGKIHDAQRIRYLDEHLRAIHAGLAEGHPIHGYFHWSLLDNFEWSHGYTKRFGLVWVDFATQVRTPKESAAWYARAIAERGIPAQEFNLPETPPTGAAA